MPISDPDRYADRTVNWLAYFNEQRQRAMRELATPEVIEQHRTDPNVETTQHRAALHLIMNYLRMAPTEGKTFVYAEQPYKRYRVGILTHRGAAPEILNDGPFETEREAVHAVFRRRLSTIGVDVTKREP